MGWGGRDFLDFPNKRRFHTRPTPRGGNLILASLTLVGIWLLYVLRVFGNRWLPLLSFTIGAVLVAIVGWRDDLRGLPCLARFDARSVGEMIAVSGIGYWSHIKSPLVGSVECGWNGVLITFARIV